MENNVSRYKSILMEENKKQNLVSRKTIDMELEMHIEDSLKPLEIFSLEGKACIDVGSGAGFPGLILSMAEPRIKMTLLESDLKKCRFLQKVIDELELNNTTVLRNRAEEVGRDPLYREKYDICTCRAVADVGVVLEYALPLIHEQGKVLLWKGPRYEEEVELAVGAMEALGGEVKGKYFYTLGIDRERVILEVGKNGPTSLKYPRRTGIPSKRPL